MSPFKPADFGDTETALQRNLREQSQTEQRDADEDYWERVCVSQSKKSQACIQVVSDRTQNDPTKNQHTRPCHTK